jgi:hypothetical protein
VQHASDLGDEISGNGHALILASKPVAVNAEAISKMSDEQKKAGRPPHEPSEKTKYQVQMMAAFGNTEGQIAKIIGISEPTLRQHYRDELDNGFIVAGNAVAQNLFRIATFRDTERVKVKGSDGATKEVVVDTKPNSATVKACEFYLRTRCGWSEYAPPPKPPKDSTPGKKEAAELASDVAGDGNEWGDLVDRPPLVN